ncbi:MAG: glucosaminidase domain-containing protein [Bacteroidales bacterium]|nr:glucosaminidase domain-containing protein [Bacteroidales bacterium]
MRKIYNLRLLLLAIILVCAHIGAYAQRTNTVYQSYIDQYAGMAIDQMNRHGIPASITLAQGLLESAAGRSTLATVANNHFGIKTGGSWSGPYVLRDDDKPNERFRKYNSAAESYEDHSLFLKKARYQQLFSLRITDYKGWAHGLKACGYATSPTYAQKLIDLIELYHLDAYDTGKMGFAQNNLPVSAATKREENHISEIVAEGDADFFAQHPVGVNNKNYYIRVLPGDDLTTISREVGVSVRKLRRYNELPKYAPLQPGTILYLKSKRKHADKAFKRHPHTVQNGQSMYDIAQMYGMKLKSLYKLNKLAPDYAVKAGDVLRVY